MVPISRWWQRIVEAANSVPNVRSSHQANRYSSLQLCERCRMPSYRMVPGWRWQRMQRQQIRSQMWGQPNLYSLLQLAGGRRDVVLWRTVHVSRSSQACSLYEITTARLPDSATYSCGLMLFSAFVYVDCSYIILQSKLSLDRYFPAVLSDNTVGRLLIECFAYLWR